MKRAGNLIERICETDNLLLAFHKAAKGKCSKQEVLRYAEHLEESLFRLAQSIRSASVSVGDYSYFKIFDPKERTICAASFSERVLHHALMNVCHETFERHLIHTTYATRPEKGVYQALNRARKAMLHYDYAVKFDVRHYFDSVHHLILKSKLTRLFKDKSLLKIFFDIIDSYHSEDKQRGLPIGNLTSQYFANYYLSDFDHWCKECLKVGEYIRYMDDFLVFCNDKSQLAEYNHRINDYMKGNLALKLKPAVSADCKRAIPFLGYSISRHKVLLTSRSKRRLEGKMRLYERLLREGKWSEREYSDHITPLIAFSKYAYSKTLRRKIMTDGGG